MRRLREQTQSLGVESSLPESGYRAPVGAQGAADGQEMPPEQPEGAPDGEEQPATPRAPTSPVPGDDLDTPPEPEQPPMA